MKITDEEIMSALKEGKRIRRTSQKEWVLKLDNPGFLLHNVVTDRFSFNIYSPMVFADDWEIVE